MGNLFSSEPERTEVADENKEDEKKEVKIVKTALMLFLDAAAEGDLAQLRELHKEDSSLVNKPDNGPDVPVGEENNSIYKNAIRSRNTALHRAAEAGQVEAARFLLNLMADVTARDCIGSTPLHRAVSCGRTEVVALLLENGANLEAANLIGNSPVHVAAYTGNTGIMELLLARGGAKLLERANSVNMTPRAYATRASMKELIGNPGDPLPGQDEAKVEQPAAAAAVVEQAQVAPVQVAPVQVAPVQEPAAQQVQVEQAQVEQVEQVQVAPAEAQPEAAIAAQVESAPVQVVPQPELPTIDIQQQPQQPEL